MPVLSPERVSPREYLERERLAETKSELLDGEIFAMAGALYDHVLITMQVAFEVRPALEGKPCRILASDLKVRVPGRGYFYPDVVLVCDPVFEDGRRDVLLNPLAVFEVLSPSTARYDLGPKRDAYLTIPSLRELVFLDPERRTIEAYVRDEAGWRFVSSDAGPVLLASVGATLDPARVFV